MVALLECCKIISTGKDTSLKLIDSGDGEAISAGGAYRRDCTCL